MAERKRRWVPIAIGVAFLFVCLAIGGMVVAFSLFRQNVETQTVTGDEATSAFDDVRRKFGDRQPLLEIRDGRAHRVSASELARSTAELQSMKILAWDPDDHNLARVTLPFWLVRLKSTPIELGAYAAGLDDHEAGRLRVEDLEAYGPGIVLEHSARGGERVLVWLE